MTTVTYDPHSFKLNNEPTLLLSGSVHYPRVHPSRWQQLFNTFHSAHLNTLETYVFWNEHEPPPAVTTKGPIDTGYDFQGRRDLFCFIRAAGENGLYVVLRIGPYVCAEVSYGGFPARLKSKPDMEFRTYNQAFMTEVETWVRYVVQRLKEERLFAPLGGPVILAQLENEYEMVKERYGSSAGRYLQWVADLQKELDMGIPAIMCYGAAEGVVETINAFYGHDELEEHWKRHPDQPAFWTECWTGWYNVWGARRHRRHVEDLAFAVLRFFVRGGGGVNYYMWMGGSNWGRGGMYLQVTSYDYDAPVSELYLETTKLRHLKRLHEVLKGVWGKERKMVMEGVWKWGEVLMVVNSGEEEVEGEWEGIKWKVGKGSAQVLRGNEVLFDTAVVHPDDIVQREYVSVGAVLMEDWGGRAEPVPRLGDIEKIAGESGEMRGVSVADTPMEQLGLTYDSSDYCFYTAKFLIQGATTLHFEAADLAYVYIDGHFAGQTRLPLWEDRWPNRWNEYADGYPGTRHEISVKANGEVDVTIMTVSMGLVKGDWQLGPGCTMLDEKKGLLSDVSGKDVERLSKWHMLPKLHGEVMRYADGFEAGREGVPGWWRCKIKLERVTENLMLDLGEWGKGMLFVNGHLVGRFWSVKATRGRNGFLNGSPVVQTDDELTQRLYHVPKWMLESDEVAVCLFVESGDAPKSLLWYTVE